MARRKSNGRFTRQTKTRRRKKQPIKVSNVAQQFIIANAVTRGVAGTNLIPFLTEGWLMPKSPGATGGAGNSWTFSLQELASGLMGQGFGQSGTGYWQNDPESIVRAVKKNFNEHGGKMLATVLFTPIAFKIGKQLLNKPVILPANRLLRSAGVREVKL